MRLLAVIVLLFLRALAWGAEEDPNYTYAISFRGGLVMTMHARPEYAATLRGDRPDCVVIDLRYRPQPESTDEDLRMESERVSAAVAAAMEGSADAVVVVKTVSSREDVWILYTASGQALAGRIDQRLSPLTRSSYKVRFEQDPEWRVFARYLERLRE